MQQPSSHQNNQTTPDQQPYHNGELDRDQIKNLNRHLEKSKALYPHEYKHHLFYSNKLKAYRPIFNSLRTRSLHAIIFIDLASLLVQKNNENNLLPELCINPYLIDQLKFIQNTCRKASCPIDGYHLLGYKESNQDIEACTKYITDLLQQTDLSIIPFQLHCCEKNTFEKTKMSVMMDYLLYKESNFGIYFESNEAEFKIAYEYSKQLNEVKSGDNSQYVNDIRLSPIQVYLQQFINPINNRINKRIFDRTIDAVEFNNSNIEYGRLYRHSSKKRHKTDHSSENNNHQTSVEADQTNGESNKLTSTNLFG